MRQILIPGAERHMGLDLSLTSTGIADTEGCCTLANKRRGTSRLIWVRDMVMERVRSAQPGFVTIEGYSMGSLGRQYDIGELGGVIRVALTEEGVPFVCIPPTKLKKWATGKGNANKDTMIENAIRRYGFTGHGNDEADAYLLYLMASTRSFDGLTAYQKDAVADVEWPSVSSRKA
jgi:Holliday junction resolvasome RuvABC endonuclease subunit